MSVRPGSSTRRRVVVVEDGRSSSRRDAVATEEPLEIRLAAGGRRRTLAVTMRTPGADFELAAGFLFGEGVLRERADIRRISYCTDRAVDAEQRYNIVSVELARDALPELPALERHFHSSSACGVCGRASLESLSLAGCRAPEAGPRVSPELLYSLPGRLRDEQELFDATGGMHAAGLFAAGGELVALREDVGRHNAMDKLVGSALLAGRLPLRDSIVLVSGRASYEILQKALAAGVPVVCSVSAPSSLAVTVARAFGITLVGFLRGRRLVIYSGAERVTGYAGAS